MGKIYAVCTSPEKGTLKTNVGKAVLQVGHGLVGTPMPAPGTGRSAC